MNTQKTLSSFLREMGAEFNLRPETYYLPDTTSLEVDYGAGQRLQMLYSDAMQCAVNKRFAIDRIAGEMEQIAMFAGSKPSPIWC
jgi:hypothetical protein